MPDSSLYFRTLLYNAAQQRGDAQWLALSSSALGDHYMKYNQADSAMLLFRKGIAPAEQSGRLDLVVTNELYIGRLFQLRGNKDSAFFYTRQALNRLGALNNPKDLMKAYRQLSDLYKDNRNFDSAYQYMERFVTLKDSLLDESKLTEAQNFVFNQALREQQVEQAKKETRQQEAARIKIYALAAVIAFILLAALLLMRNLRARRAANELLTRQKEEIQTSLAALKEAQAQLIQSEKLASLGELTAGIAHEIQNPLNFVNNFSEVSKELLEEMKAALDSGNTAEANEIAGDVMQNLEKINQHGKRADSIVKGMLQHSRSSTGSKEPVDLNA
ncbi:MAG: two-component sensor histidine kinase, partial [Chitinophagaceae bacterium]